MLPGIVVSCRIFLGKRFSTQKRRPFFSKYAQNSFHISSHVTVLNYMRKIARPFSARAAAAAIKSLTQPVSTYQVACTGCTRSCLERQPTPVSHRCSERLARPPKPHGSALPQQFAQLNSTLVLPLPTSTASTGATLRRGQLRIKIVRRCHSIASCSTHVLTLM